MSSWRDKEAALATSGHSKHEKMVKSMRRILIIDDEDDIREVASLSLEATAGWQIMTASSGAKGIELAIEHQPDAILMDVMMPGVDGPTTFRQMQQISTIAHIPVLLLTAKVQGIDKRRFADLGVAAVLFKPFDPLTLAEQISDALQWNATLPSIHGASRLHPQ
jgi:CheY-like chemotaxis protein